MACGTNIIPSPRGTISAAIDTTPSDLGGVNGVPQNTGVDVGSGQLEPRLGLAYRLNDKTVIRTGYGISSDPYYFTNMRDAYPAVISQQYAGANSYTPAGSLATGIPALVGPNVSQGSF